MERSNFFGDQFVLADDLNNISSTIESQIKKRALANNLVPGGWGKSSVNNSASVAQGGILGNPADATNTSINLYPLTIDPDTIAIAPGNALSTAGELIRNTTLYAVARGITSTNSRWTSSPSAVNYVKLRYLETSGSFKANDLGSLFPTRYQDSFWVQVDNTPPASTDIILGQFVADGGGSIIGTVQNKRLYVRYAVPADSVYLDPTVKPVAAHTTVEDHVRAVGTGAPTITNPHGLSLLDLTGGLPNDIAFHRDFEHVPGIFLKGSRSAAALNSFSASIGNTGGADFITLAAPYFAAISANGQLYSASFPNLSTSTAAAPGVFDVMAFPNGTLQWQTASITTPADLNAQSDRVWIARAQLVLNAVLPGTMLDKRQFYTIAPAAIRTDLEEATVSSAATLTDPTTTLATSLGRIRHSVGMATTGTGSVWRGPFPLTSGTGSVADDLHGHNEFALSRGLHQAITGGSITRALDHTYQNTTGRTLYVNATAYVNVIPGDTAGVDLQMSSGSGDLPGFQSFVGFSYCVGQLTGLAPSGAAGAVNVSGFVPPDYYYRLKAFPPTAPGSITLYTWNERT